MRFLVIAALLLAATCASADEYVCMRKNGEKIRVTDCRLVGPTPTPAPTATPTPTPTPTRSPLPCEQIGGTKDYSAGDEKLLCFDAGARRAVMEVSVQGQPSYAGEFAVELKAPSGARYVVSAASQPNTTLLWEPGRWYLATKLLWGTPTTLVFTPR